MNDENNWPCFNHGVSNILNFQNNATVAIKAIETVLCVDDELINEWNKFSYLETLSDIVCYELQHMLSYFIVLQPIKFCIFIDQQFIQPKKYYEKCFY